MASKNILFISGSIGLGHVTRDLVLGTIILSVLLGYIFGDASGMFGSGPGGAHGYYVSRWLNAFMGKL